MPNNENSQLDDKLSTHLVFGTSVAGNISFSTPAIVDCQLEGEIRGAKKITIGEKASVRAKIFAFDIIVFGKIEGDLEAVNAVHLKKSAKVFGNIKAPKISIEEGVYFSGSCEMIPVRENIE